MGRRNLQDERFTEILDCAEQIVIKEGLRAVTISRLGRELKIDRTTIYHYISSQADLYDAIFERVVNAYYDSVVPDPDVKPNVDTYIDSIFNSDFTFYHFDHVLDEFEARGWDDDKIRAHLERFYATLEKNSVDYIVEAMPELPKAVARDLAKALYALVEGVYLIQSWGGTKASLKASKKAAKLLVKATREAH